MSNALALSVFNNAEAGNLVTFNAKGKTGSFARAIAFANRETRNMLASGMMLKYLQNGQYLPIVNDILTCGLIPKANIDWVRAGIPETGPVAKDTLVNLCRQVKNVIDNKRTKAGEPIVLKGEKLFMFGFVSAIVSDQASDTIEA